MAKKMIPGLGWVDVPDGTVGAGAVSTDSSAPKTMSTPRGGADEYGSPAWVEQNFPEYAGNQTSVKTTTGGQMGKNGIRAPSVTRTVAMPQDVVRQQQPWTTLGFRELWESTPPDQRGSLAASVNFYKNGGKDAQGFEAVDPKLYNGLSYKGENSLGRKIFTGPSGTLVGGQHPQMYKEPPKNPDGTPGVSPKRGQEYGINSTFTTSEGTSFSPRYYGHVLKDFSPDRRYSGPGGKMVPGWQYIAKNLGLASYQPDLYTGNIGKTNYEFAGASVGDSIVGSFGYMWDNDVKTRRQTRDSRKGGSSSGGGGGGGYGGGGGGGGGSGGSGPGGGGGGSAPPGPGAGPQPNPPGGIPPRNPWDDTPVNRPPPGPVDYGPPPFDPYGGGGSTYQGYGDAGYQGYQRPEFGGDSQWANIYQNFLNNGIDTSQYAPQGGGSAPPPAGGGDAGTVFPHPGDGTGGGGTTQSQNWAAYYQNWVNGGRR